MLLKPPSERNAVEAAGVCLSLEAQIRSDLDRFAASAREVLDAAEHQSVLVDAPSVPPAAAELEWLLARIREFQPEPWPIDVKRPVFETGIDSLALIQIGARARQEFAVDGNGWLISSLAMQSVEDVAGHLAQGRTNGGAA
ncbi:acyl carrier protein [Nocardia vinacea]|uniref:acyl carrier protein n=1 Tax=Nocardia vinacea TaxID=96468 RepID=UPI002E13DFF9|nr:acyl carrier protein [Nocardia vinacea]